MRGDGFRKPKGWFDSQWEALQKAGRNSYEDDRPVKCGDCGWTGKESDLTETLAEIPDLNERLDAGDPSPTGLCPAEVSNPDAVDTSAHECGSFVYYDDIEIIYKAKPNVHEALAECAPKKKERKKRG